MAKHYSEQYLRKLERTRTRQLVGRKCVICGKTEDELGCGLEMAHVVAKRFGGKSKLPMCPNCHTAYDNPIKDDEEDDEVDVETRGSGEDWTGDTGAWNRGI